MLFDWDAEGRQNFVSHPEVPAILQEAGHKGKPQPAELGGQYDAEPQTDPPVGSWRLPARGRVAH